MIPKSSPVYPEQTISNLTIKDNKPRIQSHLPFLKWSLISLGIILCLVLILLVILWIWKKRRGLEETIGLLKVNSNPSPKDISNTGEKGIHGDSGNNQIFVIENESVDVETNSEP